MKQSVDARREGAQESTARARSLAVFYASGALLNVLSCLLPGWHPASRLGLLAIAAVALATAFGLYTAGSRVRSWVCQSLLAVGSALIAGCVISAGASPMALAYAFFFSWVSVYAANWWSVRALAAHLGFAAACEAGAVAAIGMDGLIAPSCLVCMGACAAAGLVVHRLKAQVRELAMHDPLTGALNRRGLMEVLSTLPARGTPWTVIALDLDGFKAFNDSRGHAQGDLVLRDCVTAWTALLAPGEVCARLGGDEFVLICRRPAELVEALVTAARTCAPPTLGISAGTATALPDEPAADVFARADVALYIEKGVAALHRDTGPAQIPSARIAGSSSMQVRSR